MGKVTITITNKMASAFARTAKTCLQSRNASTGWTVGVIMQRLMKKPQFDSNPYALAFYAWAAGITAIGIKFGLDKQKPHWGHAADEDKVGIKIRGGHH